MTTPSASPDEGTNAPIRNAPECSGRPIERALFVEPPRSHAYRVLGQAQSLYKAALSPFLHTFGLTASCRFQPTCSEYATLAMAQYGPIHGFWLALTRLLRCHPLARGGWDPVPSRPRSRHHHSGHHVQSEASTLDFRTEDVATLPQAALTGTIEMPHSTNEPA